MDEACGYERMEKEEVWKVMPRVWTRLKEWRNVAEIGGYGEFGMR